MAPGQQPTHPHASPPPEEELTPSERVLLDPLAFAAPTPSRRRLAPGAIVGAVLLLGGAGLTGWLGGAGLLEALDSRGWERVPGVVVTSGVREENTGDGTTWTPDVVYRYAVDGRTLEGSRIDFSSWSSDRAGAEEMVARYPEGLRVEVAVSPDDPERAALEPGPTLGTVTVLVFPLGMLVGAFFLLAQARPEVVERAADRLDGGGRVDAPELVEAALAIALLGLEEEGVVELRPAPDGPGAPGPLQVVPTGTPSVHPSTTLEGRLPVGRERSAEEVVHLWLAAPSVTPWRRAATQLEVMAVLRGLARYVPEGRGEPAVRTAWEGPPPDPGPARELLEACTRHRPGVREALRNAVEAAVERRTASEHAEGFEERDPWLDEARGDREGAGVPEPGSRTRILAYLGAGAMVWLFGFLAAGGRATFLAWSAAAILFFGLAAHPRGPVPGLLPALRRKLNSRDPGFVDGPLPVHARVAGLALGAPVAAGMGTMATVWFDPVWVVPVALVAVGVLVKRRLDTRMRRALTAEVTGGAAEVTGGASGMPGPEPVDGSPARSAVVPSPATTSGAVPAAGTVPDDLPDLPFDLAPRSSLDLPEASEESWARVRQIDERGPALRRVYRRAVGVLAGANTLLALAVGLTRSPVDLPGLVLVLAGVSALGIWGSTAADRVRRRQDEVMQQPGVRGSDRYWHKMQLWMRSPRADGLGGLTAIWFLVSGLRIPLYLGVGGVDGLGAAVLQGGLTLAAFAWVRGRLADHEGRFPRHPPLDLLALRVFRSPFLDDFLDLTDLWQWVGTRQRLDGPDTLGRTSRDLVHFVSGRMEKSVVGTETELEGALAAFRREPDKHLRYPVNSMQCSDATWKTAVRRLLDRADVVVMDLSSLGPENRGVAWELGELADRLAWDHVVLLVHETTDRPTFHEVMGGALAGVAADSPNRDCSRGPLVIDVGGPMGRDDDESLYEWRRRMDQRVSREHLVALLLDAARGSVDRAGPS